MCVVVIPETTHVCSSDSRNQIGADTETLTLHMKAFGLWLKGQCLLFMQCQCTVAHTVCLVCVVSLPLLGHVESTVLSFTGCHGNTVHITVELTSQQHSRHPHTNICTTDKTHIHEVIDNFRLWPNNTGNTETQTEVVHNVWEGQLQMSWVWSSAHTSHHIPSVQVLRCTAHQHMHILWTCQQLSTGAFLIGR